MKERSAKITRKTKETDIAMEFFIDGVGEARIDTGIGFFDHMLESFVKHGFFNMSLAAKGDLHVDSHHTIEDVGIVLGQALKEALGEKEGIKRYGYFVLPMDETLILCSLDLSGRPYLGYDVNLNPERVGYLETEMVKEFFYAVSYSAGMNLHIRQLAGKNQHHIVEGIFKAFAKALDEATQFDQRITGVLSTKGAL